MSIFGAVDAGPLAPAGAAGPTISHHLRVLRETGLVERRATWAYYRIRPEAMTQLSALPAVTTAVPAASSADDSGRSPASDR